MPLEIKESRLATVMHASSTTVEVRVLRAHAGRNLTNVCQTLSCCLLLFHGNGCSGCDAGAVVRQVQYIPEIQTLRLSNLEPVTTGKQLKS